MRPTKTPFALIGAGAMGYGLLHQALRNDRFRVLAVYDTSAAAIERARTLVASADQDASILWTCSSDEFVRMTSGAHFLIDASSAVSGTVPLIEHFIDTGRHVFMMNSEADLARGPALFARARRRGVIYSSVDGDQHGVIMRLASRLEHWGLRPVMLGNIKGFLDRRATPTSIVDEARKRDLDPVMCCSYTDGTKLAIEMALVANATGARVITRGMLGPRIAHAEDVPQVFDLDRLWDGGAPLVDYVLGAQPDGGVFVVGHSEDPYQRKMLKYYKLGDGPYYVFTRPFHLCHLETLPAIDEALTTGRALLEPVHGRQTDVFAFAKRPLRAGETLDGIGGDICYGLIDTTSAATADLLPICESAGVRLMLDVPQDAPLTRSVASAAHA